MASTLVIAHGSPKWWRSKAIWVTPVGAASTAAPGVPNPIAGHPYDVWVEVKNTSSTSVPVAELGYPPWQLNIWWAIPTAGPIPDTATTVISETTLSEIDAGKTKVFKSVTPWTPSHGGHECLIALTYNSATGYPYSSYDGDLGPDINWSIAQHNLGVVQLGPHSPRRVNYVFQVCNSAREERSFTVAARQEPLSEVEWFMRGLPGGYQAHERPGKVQNLGLVESERPDASELETAHPVLEHVKLAPSSCRKFTLVGTLDAGTALIDVTQTLDRRVVGGLSVLVLSAEK